MKLSLNYITNFIKPLIKCPRIYLENIKQINLSLSDKILISCKFAQFQNWRIEITFNIYTCILLLYEILTEINILMIAGCFKLQFWLNINLYLLRIYQKSSMETDKLCNIGFEIWRCIITSGIYMIFLLRICMMEFVVNPYDFKLFRFFTFKYQMLENLRTTRFSFKV